MIRNDIYFRGKHIIIIYLFSNLNITDLALCVKGRNRRGGT